MKKLLIILFAGLAFTACLKKVPYNVEVNANGTFVSFPLGGLSNFGGDAITASQDTVVDTVEAYYTGASLPTQPIVITLIADFPQVANYFAIDPSIAYLPMPTADFKIPSTVTIAPGTRTIKVPITIYKKLLDPSKSYMLPVTISAATPYNLVATNYATHYFHVIGNPIAGTYNYVYTRWNNSTFTNPVTTQTTSTAVFSPVDPTTISTSAFYTKQNGIGINYYLSFTNTGGVLSNFKVIFKQSDITSILTPANFAILSPPKLIQADPVKGIFEFQYVIQNSAGSPRSFDELYYK